MQLTTDRGNKERLINVIHKKSGRCHICGWNRGCNAGEAARRAKSDRHKSHRRK